jgi:ribosome-associated protein
MIKITPHLWLEEDEIQVSFIRSPGPGGQNVNKVSTAVQLRFNIVHSTSLSETIRERLIFILGNKITKDGDLIIKASRYRSQERNKQDAYNRLQTLLQQAAIIPKKRKKTQPSQASKERRLTSKKLHSKNKTIRRSRPNHEE